MYVSTWYTNQQRVSLFRNSSVAAVPGLNLLTGDWNPTQNDADRSTFREFHDDPSSELVDPSVRGELYRWHDTSLWRSNLRSYDVVSTAVEEAPTLPHGRERLLSLKSGRDRTSWVPFHTGIEYGTELRIAVAYSGEMDAAGDALGVYEYIFLAGE